MYDVYEKEGRKFPTMVTQDSLYSRASSWRTVESRKWFRWREFGASVSYEDASRCDSRFREEYEMILDMFAESNIVQRDDMETFVPLNEYARLLGTLISMCLKSPTSTML